MICRPDTRRVRPAREVKRVPPADGRGRRNLSTCPPGGFGEAAGRRATGLRKADSSIRWPDDVRRRIRCFDRSCIVDLDRLHSARQRSSSAPFLRVRADRPPIGAYMKRPPSLRLSRAIQREKRSSIRAHDRASRPRAQGMSPWRALGREQFRALTASPPTQGRPEEGETMGTHDD
jgi:hypothetical protein